MIPACLDASSYPVSVVPVSAKGGTLVDLPGNKNKVISPVQHKAMGCPDVKFPVLPLTSTPRVSGENLNAGGICAVLGKSDTFGKPSYPIPCNGIMDPIEEKVLLSPIEFPAQCLTASHLIRVDEYLDSVPWAPKAIQPTSTHDCTLTSSDEPLNCSRLVLMAKGQPQ